MNNRIKIILIFLLINVSSEFIYSQTNEITFSYGIWIREYEKEWIDGVNSFWLLESPNKLGNLESDLIYVSYLCRPMDFEAENCCNDNKYQENQKGQYYSGGILEAYEFFESKETITLKVGNKEVKIVKLEQSNCKCSNKYVNCNTKFEKVASIFNYKFLKLSKTEKKYFRKEKNKLIEYLEKNN